MKLHLGCGAVYLENYLNIDAAPHYLMPNVPPKIIEQNRTTIENYYKFDFCKGSGFCVADVKAELCKLDFENEEVEEIVLIHVLEHLPSYTTNTILCEINRVLKRNGTFIIAVPDIKETAKLLGNAKTPEEEDWYIRLIHGTQRNKWSHHYCGYTKRTLPNLLEKYGFGQFKFLENINFYPAIHIKAHKIENI